MAYGDLPLDAPEKPNKGHEGGACNRRACQAEPAFWWNHGSHSWYCADCAIQIGDDHVNHHSWYANFARFFPRQHRFPQFETREMMLERIAGGAGEHTMPPVTFDSPVSGDVIVEKLARQQGKSEIAEQTSYVLGKGRLYFDGGLKPPADIETERRYHVHYTYSPHVNRQQRRAAERAERKGKRRG